MAPKVYYFTAIAKRPAGSGGIHCYAKNEAAVCYSPILAQYLGLDTGSGRNNPVHGNPVHGVWHGAFTPKTENGRIAGCSFISKRGSHTENGAAFTHHSPISIAMPRSESLLLY